MDKVILFLGMILIGYLIVSNAHSEQVDVTEVLKVELKRLTHKHS